MEKKPSLSAGRYWEKGGMTGSTNNAAVHYLFLFKLLRKTCLLYHLLVHNVYKKEKLNFVKYM